MRRLLVLLLPVALATMAACSREEKGTEIIKPLPDLPAVTTTSLVDLSGVKLSGVSGNTTTTVALGPGKATLKGRVAGPDGPVGGATIHVERLVGDGVAAQDFASNPDGTFSIPNLLGGRYRVRAYVPDPFNLAQVVPQVFFMSNAASKDLNLAMTVYAGESVTSSIAPKPPFVGEPANLVVQVVTQTVDEKGIVKGEPVVDAKVELFGSGAWQVNTSNPTTTDERGRAQFEVQCSQTGDHTLSAVVNDASNTAIATGPCEVRPPPTTTTTAPPATAATSAPAGGSNTTATTRPSTSPSTTSAATTTTTTTRR